MRDADQEGLHGRSGGQVLVGVSGRLTMCVEVGVPAAAVLVGVDVKRAAPPAEQEAAGEHDDDDADRRLGEPLHQARNQRVRDDDRQSQGQHGERVARAAPRGSQTRRRPRRPLLATRNEGCVAETEKRSPHDRRQRLDYPLSHSERCTPARVRRVWSRRRIADMKRLLVVAVLVLALPACGGGESNRPPRVTAVFSDPRAELESRLERTSVGICNGACRTYHATVATCSGDRTELDGRAYYACRVEYETKAGHTPAPDEICAALDQVRGHVVRPPPDCRQR